MGYKVLSLFDGTSCGQLAFQKANINIDTYFACEIEPNAIAVTQRHFPNTIQLGSVITLDCSTLPEIDILIGGSPCQNLSMQVINNIKHNKGLQGEKSSLFYEYLRILTETNPKYFFFENVQMTSVNKDIITEALGVEPICVNSNILSAQDRVRYYWTNIPGFEMPVQKDIVLNDILIPEGEVPGKYWYNVPFEYHGDVKVQCTLGINGHDILKRVYNPNGKCGTLTRVTGGNQQKKVYQNGRCRKLTPLEYERLQTLPDGYTDGFKDGPRYDMIGNGWTVDIIVEFFKNL